MSNKRKLRSTNRPVPLAAEQAETWNKVVVAYPHPHEVSARFHKCWDAMRQYDFDHQRRIAVGGGHLANSSGANITNARNEIVEAFLDRHDADWLLFLDTDMTFEPNIVDRLVESAHPKERPIVGALCFSLQDGWRAAPTLYVIRDDNRIGRMSTIPGGVVRALTGTGCLLIHRTVLVALRERFPKPYQWFREEAYGDLPIGEDITFCLRAEASGFPVHVDTAIECGHEKPFVVDRQMWEAQQRSGVRERVDPVAPTYAVIPQKPGEREIQTRNLAQCLFDAGVSPTVLDDERPIHEKWNAALEDFQAAADYGPHNVLIVNNDVTLHPGCVEAMGAALRMSDEIAITYPNIHGIPAEQLAPTQGKPGFVSMAGWCFMLKGELGFRFDEQFSWWYGDTDMEAQVHAAGKQVVCVGAARAEHHEPMQSTRGDLLQAALEDEKKFAAKWDVDPAALWLASHPEWVEERS